MPLRQLSADGRVIIELANEIAHEYELEYVGTEHILLAILRHDDNVGARTLETLGVDEHKARITINDLVQSAKEDTWVFGRLPGTPHYRDVIERAMGIAEQLEARQIGSEHLLLALYHDETSTARRTLDALNLPLRKCRDEILRQLSQD